MAYAKNVWYDNESGSTPITADKLNHIEQGVFDNAAAWDSVSQYLHFERVNINKAAGNAANSKLGIVTAPAVSGYSFLAWVTVSTADWVGVCYFETPLSATTGVWCVVDTGTARGSVQCFALYVKNV